jgi:hypothetical protein
MVIVPLADESLTKLNHGNIKCQLLFSKSDNGVIESSLLVYIPDSSYIANSGGNFKVEDFTGFFVFLDLRQQLKYGFYVKNGLPVSKLDALVDGDSQLKAESRTCCSYVESLAIVDCVFQVFSGDVCYKTARTLVCCNEDEGNSGGGGGGGNGGGGGGNGGGGYGGGSPPNTPPQVPTPQDSLYWTYSGGLPLGVFTQLDAYLPEGLTIPILQQFFQIRQELFNLGITGVAMEWVLNHPEYIPLLHQYIKGPQNGEEWEIFREYFFFARTHNLSASQYEYLVNHPEVYAEMQSFFNAHVTNASSNLAASTVLDMDMLGYLSGVHPFDSGNPILNMGALPATMEAYSDFTVNCALLKQQHPDWSDIRIGTESAWQVLTGVVHTTLELIGQDPTFWGPIADGINGVIYTIEGEGVNAAISFASAIPILGSTLVGKRLCMAVTDAAGKLRNLSYGVDALGNITFGSRTMLRKVLNITDPLKEAHHIIPWAKSDNILLQKAAEGGFHMNHMVNGISLPKLTANNPTGVHANHPQYDIRIIQQLGYKLNSLGGNITNITPLQASQAVEEVIEYVRTIIAANPTTPMNDLIF